MKHRSDSENLAVIADALQPLRDFVVDARDRQANRWRDQMDSRDLCVRIAAESFVRGIEVRGRLPRGVREPLVRSMMRHLAAGGWRRSYPVLPLRLQGRAAGPYAAWLKETQEAADAASKVTA